MPKKTVVNYRVIVEFVGEGIERSLPYLLQTEAEASDLADILERILGSRYHHRVEPSITHHMNGNSSEGKEAHTYAYHGRQQ